MTERPARPHRARWIDSDLVITATPEGRTVRRRPLPSTSLCLDDYEVSMENSSSPYPFGMEFVGFAYQNAVHHLFADHIEHNRVIDLYVTDPTDSGQPVPVVNMVAIRQLSEDSPLLTESLHHVLDESTDDSSEGSRA